MLRFLLKRLLHATMVVILATGSSFVLLRLVPGDAASLSVEGPGLSATARAAVRERLALDRPLPTQVARYLGSLARGDFGVSSSEQRPVLRVLGDALPATLLLSGVALIASTLLGLTVGTLQGWRPRDRLVAAVSAALTVLYALPEIVLGIGLLAAFALLLPLFPVGGMTDPMVEFTAGAGARLWDRAWHLVLPASVLALGWSAAIVRQQRSAMRDTAIEHHIRTARAKGASELLVLRRHAMRPALPGTIALVGTMLPTLVGGTVIVESLFSWPGMGSLIVRGVALRDAPLVVGAVVIIATVIALGTVTTELLVRALDPRVREPATHA